MVPAEQIILGVQSRSFKVETGDTDALIQCLETVGLNCVEFWTGHLPMETSQIEIKETLIALQYQRIQVSSWGVINMGDDEAQDRKAMTMGRIMGLQTFSVDPSPDQLDRLAMLAEAHEMHLAIRNGGPGHRWHSLKTVAEALSRYPALGLCLDVGHCLRAGLDPAAVLDQFGHRVFGMHLSDGRSDRQGDWREVALGDGDLSLQALVQTMVAKEYTGFTSLAYQNMLGRNGETGDFLGLIRKSAERFSQALHTLT